MHSNLLNEEYIILREKIQICDFFILFGIITMYLKTTPLMVATYHSLFLTRSHTLCRIIHSMFFRDLVVLFTSLSSAFQLLHELHQREGKCHFLPLCPSNVSTIVFFAQWVTNLFFLTEWRLISLFNKIILPSQQLKQRIHKLSCSLQVRTV